MPVHAAPLIPIAPGETLQLVDMERALGTTCPHDLPAGQSGRGNEMHLAGGVWEES